MNRPTTSSQMSSHNNTAPRVSQRRSLACRECTRRKIKCNRIIPCSRCTRLGIECTREAVSTTVVLSKHGEEIRFLKKLLIQLRLDGLADSTTATLMTQRITRFENGDQDEDVRSVTSDGLQSNYTLEEGHVRRNADDELISPQIDDNEHGTDTANFVSVLENLAWGRHYGACYPHRNCNCTTRRSHSEIVSINSDSQSLIAKSSLASPNPALTYLGGLPSIEDSGKLVHFHINHLAWHHNIFHSPTFLEQCEIFWQTGKCLHPLWLAFYLSVLSSTCWSVQNSVTAQNVLSLNIGEEAAQTFFEAMVDVLYKEDFMKNVSLYSIQAIVLSTEVAHNLGLSDLNAVLSATAIRLSQCMGLHKIVDKPYKGISSTGDWHEVIEREIGKRVWCQIVIQDHFSFPFTDSYLISPGQFLTSLPINCDDHDLEEKSKDTATISSYVRTLAQMATLMPQLLDNLGPLNSRKPLAEQYRHVIEIDKRMRDLVGDIPAFLLRKPPTTQVGAPWLDIARQSLAITAADKIIMIHRPFLIASFQTNFYPYTRSTCVSAATTILRRHNEIVSADDISIWTHSAFCVTAAVVLCLELLYKSSVVTEEMTYCTEENAAKINMYHDLLSGTRESLRKRKGDMMAKRGATLIDTMLSPERADMWLMGNRVKNGTTRAAETSGLVHQVDFRDLISQFVAEDEKRNILAGLQWRAAGEETEIMDMHEPLDLDFDLWFNSVFDAGGL